MFPGLLNFLANVNLSVSELQECPLAAPLVGALFGGVIAGVAIGVAIVTAIVCKVRGDPRASKSEEKEKTPSDRDSACGSYVEYSPAVQNKEPAKEEDRYKDVRCDDEHIYEALN